MQYLEQYSELNTTEFQIDDIKEDDAFKDYINNMEHSIEMGLMRLSASLILPVQELEITAQKLIQNGKIIYLRLADTRESIAHKVSNVYKIDCNGNINGNIAYNVIGNKVIIRDKVCGGDKYYIVYHPRMFDLEKYRGENQKVYDIDLASLTINDSELGEIFTSVPDEMAITIKYLIYSDLKIEENANLANINKNYFESYLNENASLQVISHEVEMKGVYDEEPKPAVNTSHYVPYEVGDEDD